jgi:hypothetical protein
MMAAVNRWMCVLSLVLCGCGSSELALPAVVSVAPTSMAANESILLTVDLDRAPPPKFDYGDSTAELPTSARVSIGGQEFHVLQVEEKGKRLVVELPSGLPEGQQELEVTFADGRKVTFESGFMVKAPLDITALAINNINTAQIRLRPFSITIRAIGADAELFQGRVKLSVSKGSITPTVSGPFTRGTRIQEVVLDDTGGNNVAITVEDYAGHSFTSNDFRLNSN